MIVRFTNPDGDAIFINSDHVLEVHQHSNDHKLICITTIDGSEFYVQGSLDAVAGKLNAE